MKPKILKDHMSAMTRKNVKEIDFVFSDGVMVKVVANLLTNV
jgi:hypothetical protein